MRVTRDLDLAEECVQDAYARALTSWAEAGIPSRPAAWLTTTARNRALDLIRRDALFRRAMPELVMDDVAPPAEPVDPDAIADDRLRLICTCCHPALAQEAQIALTLRLLCGLSTADVARAFLVSEPTMAARITRAKKKITAARIPYRVPPRVSCPNASPRSSRWCICCSRPVTPLPPARASCVATSSSAPPISRGCCTRCCRTSADVTGLLALVLLTDARRATRLDPDGHLVLLEDQDRSQWDAGAISEGVELVRDALRHRPPSRYALQAAIAAVHAEAPSWAETDWREVVALYGVLGEIWPSPVVALNRAVAIGFADGPAAGLAALERLGAEPQLAGYGYLAAARAEFLRRLGRQDEACAAYAEALHLTSNEVEREFLQGRLEATRNA